MWSWHPNGQVAAIMRDSDIHVVSRAADQKPQPIAATPATESNPVFSPDGRWIACDSNETGRTEVYVQPYPGPGGRWQVSVEGGGNPRWSRDGRELFFRPSVGVMSMPITPGATFVAGTPRPVFTTDNKVILSWDVGPDGRFLMIRVPAALGSAAPVNLVLNWFDEVRARTQSR